MKKIILSIFLVSILALGSISPAYSVTFTLDSASAEWTSVTDGTAVSGLNTEEIRWGVTQGQQSGFRFDVTATPVAVFTGTPFALGEFTHFNHPVGIPTTSAATLELDLEITNGNTQMKTFTFDFLIDETPNTGNVAGCDIAKQMSAVPCDDIITFLNSMSSTVVTIDGVNYQLQLLGFGPTSNNIQTMFTTQENMDNVTTLWAILTTPIGGEIIPLDTTVLLLAGIQTSALWILPVVLAGAGFAAFKLRRKF